MKTIALIHALAVAIVVLIAAGCDKSPPDQVTAAAPTEYMAVGTLNSVDTAAGTVNISHNPVPAAGWPAMTMSFKVAEPGELASLTPGERVDIHFKIESGMNATITHIAAIQ
jgi:Cu(I)/Ag(I) efflux system protein CusF